MRNDIQKLQQREDAREDQRDGKRALRMALLLAPETVKSWLLPYGNVHSMVMFGPLLFEIGYARKHFQFLLQVLTISEIPEEYLLR